MPDFNVNLRLLFADILRGVSCFYSTGFDHNVYIKHNNTLDYSNIDYIKDKYFKEAKENLPTLEEKLNFLISERIWSEDREREVRDLKYFLEGLQLTKSKLHLPSQIEQIRGEIEKAEQKILEIETEKSLLIGSTAEGYAEKRSNEYLIWQSSYADANLKNRLFDEAEFDKLEDIKLIYLVKEHNEYISQFNEKNLKKLALSPFFLNLFYLCKNNPFTFYGRPVVELTYFQIQIFGHGMYFKSILQDLKSNNLSEDILNDPDKLVEYYESTKNAEEIIGKGKMSNDYDGPTATSIAGATKEDLKKLGYEVGGNKRVMEALKNKGTLTINDLAELDAL